MKKVYIILIIFINLILQVSLYNFVKIFDVIPNIALILVVLFSLTTNVSMGGFIGLFTGIIYDVLIMDVVGINALIYFIIGVTLGHFSEEVNRENKMLFVFVTVIATVFYHLMNFLILFFLKADVLKITLILDKILIQIVLNAVFCFIVQHFINYIFNLAKIKLFNNRL